jgi:hypothetical protein
MLKTTCDDEKAFIFSVGIARVMSLADVMLKSLRLSLVNAVTAMPTSCRRCSRRCAVMTMSPVSTSAATAVTCASNGAG